MPLDDGLPMVLFYLPCLLAFCLPTYSYSGLSLFLINCPERTIVFRKITHPKEILFHNTAIKRKGAEVVEERISWQFRAYRTWKEANKDTDPVIGSSAGIPLSNNLPVE